MTSNQDKELKGLILAAGNGTRLRPFTHTLVKPLMPVANKPIIQYIIEDLKECGIINIGIVIGNNKRLWDAAIGDGKKLGVKITYVTQKEPKGLADGLMQAKEFLNESSFVLYLGDILRENNIVDFVDKFKKEENDARVLIKRSPVPQKFGVVEINENKEIINLEEKPKHPKSDKVLIGIYAFKKSIFEAIENTKPSERGELELTDAMKWLIEKNRKIKSELVEDWWHDAGRLDSFLEANYFMLRKIKRKVPQKIDGTNIVGEVEIGEGTQIDPDTKIIGPVIIGKNCIIGEGTYIGPYTSLGDRVKIINSTIENSIVLRDSEIKNLKRRIKDSMIGHKCKINNKTNEDLVLYVGDHSQINI